MDYWIHRSFHIFDRLWWVHALHHSAKQMHVLKGGRMHFMEEVITALITPLPFLILGLPTEVILMTGIWGICTSNMSHSNVDQRFPAWAHYFLPTVQLHNLHHAIERQYQDSNYAGTTPIWDCLFGTFKHPDRCTLNKMGLEEDYVPNGFLKQLLFPFQAQVKNPLVRESE